MRDEVHDFAVVLLERARAPHARKTERTRIVLLASIAAELAAGGRAGIKVAAVSAGAGLAHGTYYRYFDDVDAGIDALLDAFSAHVRACLDAVRDGDPGSRERIRAVVRTQVALFRDNGALMARLISPGPAVRDEDTAGTVRGRDWEWQMRMAATIAKGRSAGGGPARQTPAQLLPLAYALSGMVEAFLSRIYLRREPVLVDLADDEEGLADFLTDLWWRGAFGDTAV